MEYAIYKRSPNLLNKKTHKTVNKYEKLNPINNLVTFNTIDENQVHQWMHVHDQLQIQEIVLGRRGGSNGPQSHGRGTEEFRTFLV